MLSVGLCIMKLFQWDIKLINTKPGTHQGNNAEFMKTNSPTLHYEKRRYEKLVVVSLKS